MNEEKNETQEQLRRLSEQLSVQECACRRQMRRLSSIVLVLVISGVISLGCGLALRDSLADSVKIILAVTFVIGVFGGPLLIRFGTPWIALDRGETLTEIRLCRQDGNKEAIALLNRMLLSGKLLTERRLRAVKTLQQQAWHQAWMREQQRDEQTQLRTFLATDDDSGDGGKRGEE